jgi:hypothetical protein
MPDIELLNYIINPGSLGQSQGSFAFSLPGQVISQYTVQG